MQPRLTRSRTDRLIGGVCGGLGYYFGIDPVIVRLIFVVLTFTTFVFPVVYPILWLVMPEAGSSSTPPIGLPPEAPFDPMTGQPLPPRQPPISQPGFGGSVRPPTPESPVPPNSRHRTLGLLLMGVGGVILLHTVGSAIGQMLNIDVSGFVVPMLLVGVGVYLLRKKTV